MQAIRPLEAQDWDQWLPLWHGYLKFYRAELSAATTKATFERLTGDGAGDGAGDGDRASMFGLYAADDDGIGLGFTHCIVHPTTWSRRPYCYLEDLFVAPAARGTDLGKELLEAAKQVSLDRGAGRLYWHTQEYNGRARSLYDQVGQLTPFIVYEM
jgi:GNAT superfamily N-acetyltransferase